MSIARHNSSAAADILSGTAFHEAGHAVMSYRFRNIIRDRGVSIDLTKPGNGETHVRPIVILALAPDRDDHDRWNSWTTCVWREVMVCLAGPLAEFRYTDGRFRGGVLVGNMRDLVSETECMNHLGYGENEYAMWMACEDVRRFLRQSRVWNAVGELAGLLLCHGRVSAEDTDAIFERYRVPRITKRQWATGE